MINVIISHIIVIAHKMNAKTVNRTPITITLEKPAKLGIFGQKGANNYYDKSIIHLPRQDLPGMMKSLKLSYKSRK